LGCFASRNQTWQGKIIYFYGGCTGKKTSVNGLFFIATFELAFLIGIIIIIIIIICLKPTICHLGAFGSGVYTQPWLPNMLGK